MHDGAIDYLDTIKLIEKKILFRASYKVPQKE
jgi:hypothetical protein